MLSTTAINSRLARRQWRDTWVPLTRCATQLSPYSGLQPSHIEEHPVSGAKQTPAGKRHRPVREADACSINEARHSVRSAESVHAPSQHRSMSVAHTRPSESVTYASETVHSTYWQEKLKMAATPAAVHREDNVAIRVRKAKGLERTIGHQLRHATAAGPDPSPLPNPYDALEKPLADAAARQATRMTSSRAPARSP
ncbi:hypothetical protein WOLCODRAFT_161174 [Wolfiporia cocos MD-104 SS10]|uniref:Uncharacterized protein n=1 Tax=Wolfiporia cocos (strain MD-104) TaxID=742152 RepID=A0A2H3J6P8_WOLCO|nr:hypothetical protein WOLCODRAFT_161174 [Wolfiporia cocos MD-104 SS10]